MSVTKLPVGASLSILIEYSAILLFVPSVVIRVRFDSPCFSNVVGVVVPSSTLLAPVTL